MYGLGRVAVLPDQRALLAGHSTFTTCDLLIPHYHFSTGEIKFITRNLLVARSDAVNGVGDSERITERLPAGYYLQLPELSSGPLAGFGEAIALAVQDVADMPAITHIDYSARVQTVTHETNPNYYDLIKEFESRTGCAVIVNTSFNVRGEPIVCTPQDAYRCFMRTEIDALVLEDVILL